jgi:hypothetical protein
MKVLDAEPGTIPLTTVTVETTVGVPVHDVVWNEL